MAFNITKSVSLQQLQNNSSVKKFRELLRKVPSLLCSVPFDVHCHRVSPQINKALSKALRPQAKTPRKAHISEATLEVMAENTDF